MLICESAKGILAGLCISLGGSVFLACDNKYVGAVLFSVALLSICMFGFSLYTGKIGYIVEKHTGSDIISLFAGLFGNLVGCAAFGFLYRAGLPELSHRAEELCLLKLGETAPEALIRAFFCGVLMYIAVWSYREKNTCFGILFCVPVFILSGFEHSIANAFYFSAAANLSPDSLFYIFLVIAGNTVGGCTIPVLLKLTKEKKRNE